MLNNQPSGRLRTLGIFQPMFLCLMGDSQHKARAHLNKNVVRVYRATCFRQVTLLRSACNELTVL